MLGLHDLSGPAQSENVGPSCWKIIKKFKTATAEQQTRYRVLLGVGTCVCRGPTCEASPGHLSSSVTLQAVFQRLREAPTASLPVQAWVSQEQWPQPRIRLWGQYPSNDTLPHPEGWLTSPTFKRSRLNNDAVSIVLPSRLFVYTAVELDCSFSRKTLASRFFFHSTLIPRALLRCLVNIC